MKYKLEDICNRIYSGGTPSTTHKEYWNGDLPWLSSGETSQRFVYTTEKFITKEGVQKSSTKYAKRNSIVMASAGQGHTRGQVSFLMNDMYINQSVLVFEPEVSIVNPLYLYYNLDGRYEELRQLSDGTSTRGSLSGRIVKGMEIDLPNLSVQDKIVSVLYDIDKKIENNNQINRNLSEQALAIYRKMFVEIHNNARIICRIGDFFDITIGKTPPRKEIEWFSNNTEDYVWISISDMNSCGIFITESSEHLTQAAIDKYNIKVIPDNTVILSFKLTVGRIAITVGETTTNEAIAHFNTSKENIAEYLYCYLKLFNFNALGSTSSIGMAINSKTIKAMDFVIPEETELKQFYDIVRPIFEVIKKNQIENKNLVIMREALLPKLMLGELDVSNLNIY